MATIRTSASRASEQWNNLGWRSAKAHHTWHTTPFYQIYKVCQQYLNKLIKDTSIYACTIKKSLWSNFWKSILTTKEWAETIFLKNYFDNKRMSRCYSICHSKGRISNNAWYESVYTAADKIVMWFRNANIIPRIQASTASTSYQLLAAKTKKPAICWEWVVRLLTPGEQISKYSWLS